jgi:hypothetical protein
MEWEEAAAGWAVDHAAALAAAEVRAAALLGVLADPVWVQWP